ncbi:MAG: translation initiation factor IF-2 N-terminal domain-containing protein, partial [Microbacteriaceae bacterium]|nr:translation initiation factor IF-2 N-terminal domain-containing protein [Microbacteriaceae bacterium]
MAGKPRVHEIAAEFGIESKQVIEKLGTLGEFVKSSSSTIEPPVARKLREAFTADGLTKQDAAPAPAKKPVTRARTTAQVDLPDIPSADEAAKAGGKPPVAASPAPGLDGEA